MIYELSLLARNPNPIRLAIDPIPCMRGGDILQLRAVKTRTAISEVDHRSQLSELTPHSYDLNWSAAMYGVNRSRTTDSNPPWAVECCPPLITLLMYK